MFVPLWLLILLSGFGCWGILVFINAIRNRKSKVDAPSTSTNNHSDEIAWLEKVASYPKSIGENFHVGIILKRLAQLRTMR